MSGHSTTTQPTLKGLEALQVDMDPVRLVVTCMALSLHNGQLAAEVARLKAALAEAQNTKGGAR